MDKKILEGLTEEQIAKVKECDNTNELLALAKKEGLELTSEQLEAVNGGACSNTDNCPPCPHCGSSNVKLYKPDSKFAYKCKNCGKVFEAERTHR